MDAEVLKLNRNKSSEDSSNSHETEKTLAREGHFKQYTNDEGETSNQNERVNPNEEVLDSKEKVIKPNTDNMTGNEEEFTQKNEYTMINEVRTNPHEEDMLVKENLTSIKLYFTINEEEVTTNREVLSSHEEKPKANMQDMITNEEAMTSKEEGKVMNEGEKSEKKGGVMKNEENQIINKVGKAPNEQGTTTHKEGMTKIQEDSDKGMASSKASIETNLANLELNLANFSLILGSKILNQKTHQSNNPAAKEIFPHSLRHYNNIMAFYNKLRKDSVDSSTNTSFLSHEKQELREDNRSDVTDDPGVQRNFVTELPKGLMECHSRVFNILPGARKFMFCLPLHYGVYFIMCVEQIFFFLRGYTRVLNLAMPEFFPWLKNWLLICELLLSLLIMTSNIFLLVGIFLKPSYIFFWLDIHVLEVLAYVCLIISLGIADSGCVWECRIIYCCYIICFVYFVTAVNALRMSLQLPIVSHVNLESHHVV